MGCRAGWLRFGPLIWLSLVAGSAMGFDGHLALKHIQTQVDMGPRYLSSPGHRKIEAWLPQVIQGENVQLQIDQFEHVDAHHQVYQVKNFLFRFFPQRGKRLILGAHYDTRRYADKDTEDPMAPMPGANDGASGVAVLTALSLRLPELLKSKDFGVDLVFFDAEEGELDPDARPWRPIGSIHFARNLETFYPTQAPELAVVVDMVCDRDLQLKLEQHSMRSGAASKAWELWKLGAALHPGFINTMGYSVYDDHFPLIQKGVPSILLIDFDYPAWHTRRDQIDQCAVSSLQAVGQSLENFLSQY